MKRGLRLMCRALPFAVPTSRQLARVVVPEITLKHQGAYSLNAEDTKHVTKVLRYGPGDQIELVTGAGQLQRCQLAAVERATPRKPASASVVACGPVESIPWQGPKLDLIVASGSLKGGRSDWLIEKATELHAYAFTPLLTANSSTLGSSSKGKPPAEASQASGRLDRWHRVAAAALKQSLRLHALKLPAQDQVWTVEDAAAALSQGAAGLVAVQGGGPVLEALVSISQGARGEAMRSGAERLLLMVGPEGDWTSEEVSKLLAAGAVAVGLGHHRLRVETAALALLSASMLHFDVLGAHDAHADGAE